jgi:hypothetical protein
MVFFAYSTNQSAIATDYSTRAYTLDEEEVGEELGEATSTINTWEECDEQYDTNHPGRNSCYDLTVMAHRENVTEWFSDKTDYLFIEWVRQASNVSPLFRKELGDVFWTNIHLRTSSPDSDSTWQLPYKITLY